MERTLPLGLGEMQQSQRARSCAGGAPAVSRVGCPLEGCVTGGGETAGINGADVSAPGIAGLIALETRAAGSWGDQPSWKNHADAWIEKIGR